MTSKPVFAPPPHTCASTVGRCTEALAGYCIINSPHSCGCAWGGGALKAWWQWFLPALMSSLAGWLSCFSSPSRMSCCPFKPNAKVTKKCLCVCVCGCWCVVWESMYEYKNMSVTCMGCLCVNHTSLPGSTLVNHFSACTLSWLPTTSPWMDFSSKFTMALNVCDWSEKHFWWDKRKLTHFKFSSGFNHNIRPKSGPLLAC